MVSPFISTFGARLLAEETPSAVDVEVWTRLSLPDWAGGYSDPPALFEYLQPRMAAGIGRLLTSPRLHAKAFVSDSSHGLAGSANLSGGGLLSNVEIWSDDDVAGLLEVLEGQRNLLAEQSEAFFQAWVSKLSEFQQLRQAFNDLLEQPAAELPAPGPLQSLMDIEPFVEWCRAREGVNELARRAVDFRTNRTSEHTSGHMNQAYFAVQLFFDLAPDRLSEIQQQPEDVEVQLQDSELFDDWLAFLDLYRDYEDPTVGYRTRTLLGYLTPLLGGVRTGGGGGDFKVKIAIPLVSHFLADIS